MTVVEKGDIWTFYAYDNFILKCDFKLSPKCNSGVFVRTGDINQKVQTGIEVQILGPDVQPHTPRNACGAIYDCLAPSEQAVRPPGEWNSYVITCNDNIIDVVLNDVPVIHMNLDEWNTPGQNPDGTPNKFEKALKNFPHEGYIGLQYHGQQLWFKNLKIKELP
jgi:hypothetical protein